MTVDTGLADGEDRIPLRFLVLTQYRSVTDVQIFRSIHVHSACKASFVARCKNWHWICLSHKNVPTQTPSFNWSDASGCERIQRADIPRSANATAISSYSPALGGLPCRGLPRRNSLCKFTFTIQPVMQQFSLPKFLSKLLCPKVSECPQTHASESKKNYSCHTDVSKCFKWTFQNNYVIKTFNN